MRPSKLATGLAVAAIGLSAAVSADDADEKPVSAVEPGPTCQAARPAEHVVLAMPSIVEYGVRLRAASPDGRDSEVVPLNGGGYSSAEPYRPAFPTPSR